MKLKANLIIGLAVTAILAVVIAVATLAPFPAIGHVNAPGSDKLHHLLVFAALAAPLSFANPRLGLPVVLAAMTYGGLIEVVQPFVGRSAEWQDFGANIVGAVLGAGLGAVAGFVRSRNAQSALRPVKASG